MFLFNRTAREPRHPVRAIYCRGEFIASGDRQGCGPPIPTYPVMGNPYISPIARGYLWVFSSPRMPREHNKYHGYTVRGTPNCPLITVSRVFFFDRGSLNLTRWLVFGYPSRQVMSSRSYQRSRHFLASDFLFFFKLRDFLLLKQFNLGDWWHMVVHPAEKKRLHLGTPPIQSVFTVLSKGRTWENHVLPLKGLSFRCVKAIYSR